jgi:two-component system phosphate regulon sensor histidine kinase PhoR
MFKAKTVRIISIIGVILLLILQYIWFKNSYILMEHDVIEKVQASLNKAIELEMYDRINHLPINFTIKDKASPSKDSKIILEGQLQQTIDLNKNMQEFLFLIGKPSSILKIDSLFKENLKETIGFVPSYEIKLVNKTNEIHNSNNKYILYNKIRENQYLQVSLKNPLGSILRQAQLIVIASIMLVVLIGVILIIQLRGMLRENRFVEFIKDYTHALTHELKTPISGIYMSSSQLISGKLENNPSARLLHYKICRDQSAKLLTTVERILVVAKAEHSKIIPEMELVNVADFIDNIAANFRQSNFRQKELLISTSIPPDLYFYFDPVLMENVLSNLIDNAIKYSNTSVTIAISGTIDKDKKLQIRIKDNGFGMSEQEIKHIFDNFERGDKIKRSGIDGFGIGLNYVNKVIKAHKGKISVSSKEGEGSEFVITLPND